MTKITGILVKYHTIHKLGIWELNDAMKMLTTEQSTGIGTDMSMWQEEDAWSLIRYVNKLNKSDINKMT